MERPLRKYPLEKGLEMVIPQEINNLLFVIAVNPVVKLEEKKVTMTMNTMPSFKGKCG